MAALVLAVVSNYEKRMADGTVRSSGERCVFQTGDGANGVGPKASGCRQMMYSLRTSMGQIM
jgi:hypothetical protein